VSYFDEGGVMINWKESYSTGIAKLDSQHKSLFQYCNDLEEGLKNKGVSKSSLERDLSFLERYAKGHFGQEETCMYKYACPIAETNKSAHQEFIDKYKIFQQRITDGNDCDGIFKELHVFLENWLTNHIAKIDTKLKPCVK